VLDLWPESLEVAGGITNKHILGVFEAIAKWCYRSSDRILMSSKGFSESICAKGDFADKLVYFPNWADGDLARNSEYKLPAMPDGFKIMFAGNVGEAQDFDHTLEAFKILHDRGHKDIHFVIVGNGRKREWVENYVAENNLQDIVHCLGRHPLESMGKFFAAADVLYLALKDCSIFNLTCPAKLQAYMSVGKPVLAMLNGDGANIIRDAQCGFSVPAGSSEELADAIVKMTNISSEDLQTMGENGKVYCAENFSFEKNMANLINLMDR
jgi:glycosyltransferase involved in cell wall biosynthesis